MNNEKTKDWKKFKQKVELELEDENDELTDDTPEEHHESALDHPSYTALEEKLTLAEQEKHKNWEMAVRLKAELENVMRRSQLDVQKAHQFGQVAFVSSLLPVVDSLEQALQLAEKTPDDGMYEGLQLTMKLLTDAFAKQGVEEINPLNQAFNPQEHEAMSMIDDKNAVNNSVINVFQKGYKIADRVVRPARVIVARNNSNEN